MRVLMLVLLLSGAALAQAPAPEHGRLTELVGTYNVTITFWFPDKAPVVTHAKSVIRPLFDGLFIEEVIDGSMGGRPFQTRSWTGWNAHRKLYEVTRIASTNTIQLTVAGGWDDAQQRFELKASYPFAGETWTAREVVYPRPEGMVAESWMSHGGGPEWKGAELRYSKRLR